MLPVLVELGPIRVYSYGLMLVVAFLTATWLASRAARRLPERSRAVSAEGVVDLTCCMLLGGVVGARVFYVWRYWEVFSQFPSEIFALWRGGLIWYGGFFGAYAGEWLYVKAQRLVPMRVADQIIPYGALGHAIGRFGCFLNGCCYGKPTTAWWGVVFSGREGSVIPTQLFEMGGLLLLVVVLRRLQRPRWLDRPGRVFSVYLMGYGVLRFGLEMLRGDQTTSWAGMTLQQMISLGLIATGLILFVRAKVKSQKEKGKTTIRNSKF